jgi:hypothetical protein
MIPILKFPRTPHLHGSSLQPGDEDVPIVAPRDLQGHQLVIEEKVDGANSGISFASKGSLILRSRGHVLSGGPRERQFDLFKRWANHHRGALWKALQTRYVMYGEWLYARHTIAYDELPHYFLEFDLLDRQTGTFLDTERRRAILKGLPIVSVPVLATGRIDRFESLLGPSLCASAEPMEGLYIKWEQDGEVLGRYKYIRNSFRQAVEDEGIHWIDRPIEPNRLKKGVDLFAVSVAESAKLLPPS